MNNYKKISEKKLQVVDGGNKWGSAAIGGMGGGTSGIKLCAAGGPWASAGCGAIGIAVGAWAGYHGS